MPKTVIGNAGDYFAHLQFGNIHWTVGEIATSNFYGELELGEGFHQTYYDLVVNTINQKPIAWKVKVFPNPTTNQLNIETRDSKHIKAQLFSATGQLVLAKEEVSQETQLIVSHLPAGTYWLRLSDKSGQSRSFKIQKISK
ncbi:MAG: T9SS type A sorting domain-containing protein [Crocinitomicaceae bacterium]|nr:T9SS type A sorting domain-containing protein [Crocinitomicaceae bacterium]